MSSEKADQILESLSMPPKPELLMEINRAEGDLDKIGDLITHEIGIAASVLKAINSPAFGLRQEITSIQQAVVLLGMHIIKNIVTSQSLRSAISGDVDALNDFWDASKDVAIAASALSKRLNISSPDVAYTMALFHNCGIPLLMQKYSNYNEIVEKSYANSFGIIKTVEQEHIKLDHAYIGGKICDSWNMPKLITQITLNHHDVEEQFADSEDTEFLDHLALIKMAENTAELYRVLGKQETDYEWNEIEMMVTSHLGISADDYLNIRDDIREVIAFE